MIPSKLFPSLNTEFLKKKSSASSRYFNGVALEKDKTVAVSSKHVFPTETDDYRHTEGYHKVHAKGTLSSRYFPKNREIKLKKADHQVKTTKFNDFIENWNYVDHLD